MQANFKRCHQCGAEKNPEMLETFPYPDGALTTEMPISPLVEIDCEPTVRGNDWKRVEICHRCFHELKPDMWINEAIWASLNPVTPFDALPDLESEQ